LSQITQNRVLNASAAVYPGHCVTLAYLIMQAYPSLEVASSREDGAPNPHALSNRSIPGAGGPVYAALDVLHHAFEHGVDSALAYGDRIWEAETATGFNDRRQSGQLQADGIKAYFRERFKAWPQREASVV
jgi:hypothetical protein